MLQQIVITEFMDESAMADLGRDFEVQYDPTLIDRRDEILGRLAKAGGLIVRNRTQVDAALLARAPALRVVGRLGVGLDNIDTEACQARGIEVIPATGANARAVAEYVISTVMMLLRGAYYATDAVADGKWPRTSLGNGRETAGKTLGIVGFGGIGRLTARLAQALGMKVIAHDALLGPDDAVWSEMGVARRDLHDLLAEADAVTLHLPLTDATRGLFNARTLAQMKPDAILVNTSRGGIVDETALATALRDERLGGAALDVFEREPLPAQSHLQGVPRLILTPHVAGVTRESNVRVSSLIAERVAAVLNRSRG